jgi:NadR type nicotinamide-nucleotide adenylyltransferase
MKRISITGPESSGKSELAAALAGSLNTAYVPEIAREYLEGMDREYREEDLVKIAMQQCQAEDVAALSKPDYLICDTDMLVMKIWSEVKYGRVHPFILDQYRRRKYDLVLLMSPDLPWVDDPLREHPEKREELFEMYRSNLETGNFNFEIITGPDEIRLQNALSAMRKHHLLKRD